MGGCGPVAVHPEYAGTGIFMALIAPQKQHMREAGVQIVRAVQDSVNTKNFGFYYLRVKMDPIEIAPVLRRAPKVVDAPEFDDVRRIEPADLPRVVAVEKHGFFDGDRTPEFTMFLREGPGYLVERDGDIVAYGFVGGTGDSAYLSPVGAYHIDDAKKILLTASRWAAAQKRTLFMAPMASDRPFVEEAFRLGFTLNHVAILGEIRLTPDARFERKGIYAMCIPPCVP
jgi:hypothetical protein